MELDPSEELGVHNRKMLDEARKKNNLMEKKEHDVWECRYEPDLNESWRLYRRRPDKDFPNSEYTVERNLKAMAENVTFDQLVAFVEQKERAA